jgi:hypothetical protein
MLRERDDDPKRGLEVVNINIKSRVFFVPKCVITLRKSKLEHGTIFLCQDQILFPGTLFRRMPICQIHLCWYGAGDGEVDINIGFGGDILEVDGCVVLVLGLAEVESELIVDGEVVEAALLDRVSKIMVLSVALLAMVSGDAFSGAVAVPTPVITESALTIALALAALPPVDRVAEEPLAAPLTVLALSVVLTRLLAHTRHRAGGVPVALAEGARGEVPLLLHSRADGAVGPGPGPCAWNRSGGIFVLVVNRGSEERA